MKNEFQRSDLAPPTGSPAISADVRGATISLYDLVYLWLAGIFVTCLIIANITGSKFFDFGVVDILGWKVAVQHSVGMFAFPVTFQLTDLLNEYYGPRGARRVTLLGFGTSCLCFLLLHFAIIAPAAPPGNTFVLEAEFDRIIGSSQGMIIASLTAYVVGQFTDIYVFGLFKWLTQGQMIWLRATGSTVISQLLDSLCISTIVVLSNRTAAGHYADPIEIFSIAAKGYTLKFLIAVGITPILYLGHGILRRGFGFKPLPSA